MNKWQQVWNKKERVNDIILDCLIRADGFDVGAGSFTVRSWLEYTSQLFNKIHIKDSDTIFDVGCGSGAFLFPLSMRSHKVGGVDYSQPLIGLADSFINNGEFEVNEAVNIDIDEKFNVVVSHCAFHYFKELDYARRVVIKMIQKSERVIAILDVNDKSKEDIYHQTRMPVIGRDEYIQKYKGLKHLFYTKKWFNDIAKEFDLKCEIFDQDFPDYGNSSLRFNVLMIKS